MTRENTYRDAPEGPRLLDFPRSAVLRRELERPIVGHHPTLRNRSQHGVPAVPQPRTGATNITAACFGLMCRRAPPPGILDRARRWTVRAIEAVECLKAVTAVLAAIDTLRAAVLLLRRYRGLFTRENSRRGLQRAGCPSLAQIRLRRPGLCHFGPFSPDSAMAKSRNGFGQ